MQDTAVENSRQDWLNRLSSRSGAGLGALLVFLLLLGGGWVVEKQQAESVRAGELAKMLREISILRARVESALNAKLYLVQSLNALVHAEPTINEHIFQQFAVELGTNIRSIRSLQLAPQGVVKYVWPVEGNRAAIGHDLFADAERRRAANLAIASRSIWLAGPVNLIQGGTALIGRLPIFLPSDNQENAFWGFGTILLDMEELVVEVGLDRFAQDHQVAVRGADALGRAGETFYGRAELFDSDVVTSAIQLPAGSWEMGSIPLNGWAESWPGKVRNRVLWLLACFAVAAFTFWLLRLPHSLRLAVGRATAALSRSEERFRDAIEALPDGFAIYDSEGTLVVMNEQLRSQFRSVSAHVGLGNTYAELLRKGIELGQYRFGSEAEAKNFVEQQLRRRESGVSFSERQLSDGRWLYVTESAMSDGGFVAFYRDISELKQKELQLTDEKMRAEAANRAKSDFLATVSHELRTPLNAILGLLDLLADDPALSGEQRHFIETAHGSAKHLLSILNEILDISKMEAGKLELENSPFVPSDTLHAAVDIMRANAEQKSLTLRCDIADELQASLLGDAGRLRQVVLNLLGNAVKFSDAGEIVLRARCLENRDDTMVITIEVSDQGIGFDAADAAQLFEPFAQADSSSVRSHSGTGLGLAICKRIVEKMGGQIHADSEPGLGSRFALTLPLPKAQSGRPLLPSERGWRPLQLLLLEPSLPSRVVFEAMLKGSGYELEVVADPEALAAAMARRHYDIVVFDCPSAAVGAAHLAVIHAQPQSPQTIALRSGRASLSLPVDVELDKPVEKAALLAALLKCAELRPQLLS